MVHKKYIKRGEKIFGPYLYENYRENGAIKTRYLGRFDKKRNRKKLWVNKIFLLGIVLLIIFLLVLIGEFFGIKNKEFLGELASQSPFNFLVKLFTSTSPINVFVEIIGDYPPEILNTQDEILVCENTRLSYFFSVSDLDGIEDVIVRVSPILDLFFIRMQREINNTQGEYEFFSWRNFLKGDIALTRIDNQGWAVYPETITADDGERADSAQIDVVIIEVNNPPTFNIGAETIELYVKGDNNIFYYDLGENIQIRGEETPTENLTFNLTFLSGESFFNISSRGIINVTGNESFILAGENSTTYWINVSVYDRGLQTIIHPNISICLPQDNESKQWSDNFYLTVTKENRAPTITSYYPLNLSLNITGGMNLYFNITARDPDLNPVDVYWYVDEAEEKYLEALYENNFSEFEYAFGCGISGNRTVKLVVTDGLLNDSVQWNLSVSPIDCPIPQPSVGGGGGSIGKLYCEEKWGCNEWKQCENLNKLIKEGWASKETEFLIKERCEIFNFTGDFCGLQTRICTDFNYCKTEFDKPGILRECYYTENPNCADSIKNCHNGSCEVLVDCGGPCLACPTCSDEIQNQGEEKIDCGGPCEPCKELPLRPILFKSIVSYSLIALLILVLILVVKEIKEYFLSKKRAEKESLKNIIKQEKKTYIYRMLFVIFVVLLLFLANVYITRVIQLENIVSGFSEISEIALASYGFINSFIRSIGILFLGGPFVSGNEKLIIWDDTDAGIKKSGWNTFFYANYTNLSDNEPLSSGICSIRFENYSGGYGSWELMTYDGIGTFIYNRTFNYKGSYNFEVNCSIGFSSINGEDEFTITNSIPVIMEESGGGWINFDGNPIGRDAWQCVEDVICYYNFSANVSDPDVNDVLTYSYGTENTTLTNYFLNETTGILEINITHSNYAKQDRRIELKVHDSDFELWRSALLEVDIQDVNDAPVFINLTNKIFNALDLFEYTIYVTDEENNFPFKFNISFVNCSNFVSRGNCTLFTESQYSVDEIAGRINISFIPSINDVGSYTINFSVMDNSSLGNKTSSVLVNFSVNIPLWTTPLALEHILTEDEEFYLNLSENVSSPEITFSNNSGFYSFKLASNGIINFTPMDRDVGYHEVEIIASDLLTSSPKTFSFNVSNINDEPFISSLQADGASVTGSNMTTFENANVKIYLLVQDDDFLIEQKNFYDENLTINLTIEGNSTLFEFVFNSINGNEAMYTASFIPRDSDVGSYNISINVTDKNNSSAFFRFNLTILNRDYDTPVINYPLENYEFNLKENITSDLIFMVNHTVGDNLTYRFFINNVLKYTINYYGDGRNLTWRFTPNFTEETYGLGDLTLIVLNPIFSELNNSRAWNLTINHTNAPVELIREIGDRAAPYTYVFQIDLKDYFLDIDHEDSYYNQNVSFIVLSNSSPSFISVSDVLEDWTFTLSSLISSPHKERLNITAYDLNETGENISWVTSNNFIVEFIEPTTIPVPTPTPSGGGGGSEKIISLKIIMPGRVSVYEHEKIDIPLSLENKGNTAFNGLTLSSSAFKDGNISKEVSTNLSKIYFKSLVPGKKEELNLSVFFDTDKIGDYEVLVNATSKEPRYTDWGKIHISLQRINESQIRELIIFTEEFIAKNPQCIEISEVVKEAEKLFENNDYANAKAKTEEALSSCRKSISQQSIPKEKTRAFGVSLYLALTILLAFILGIAYYFLKRRKIQNKLETKTFKI